MLVIFPKLSSPEVELWLPEDEIIFYGVAVVPQPFCGAIFQEFVKDPFPQKAPHSYLGLHETVEKVASQKENGGRNTLAVMLYRHRGRACVLH